MNADTPNPALSSLDRWGIMISSACLVHCLALPLLGAMLPLFAASLPADEWVHPLLLGTALPVTGLALLRGYRRHRLARPALLGCLGLGLITAALFSGAHDVEAVLTVAGGLLVATAHLLNWRSHRRTAHG